MSYIAAKLKGFVSPEELKTFLTEVFKDYEVDITGIKTQRCMKLADLEGEYTVYDKSADTWTIIQGNIHIVCPVVIFYSYSNIYHKNDYVKLIDGSEVREEYTYISMDISDNNIQLMKLILCKFGGWLDIDNGDKEDYVAYERTETLPEYTPPCIELLQKACSRCGKSPMVATS